MKRYISILISLVVLIFNLQAQNIECIGNTIEFPLNGFKNGTIQWQFSTNETDWINLPNSNTDDFVYNITETGYFRARVSRGDCQYFSDTTFIEAYPEPSIANAGTDQTIGNSETEVSLNANIPAFGTGKWSLVSGGTGSFANEADPAATFTGSQCVDYVLRWTISTECNYSFDDVNIGFHAIPTTANAGADQAKTNADISVNLSANTPVVGTGKWTVISGGTGSFANDMSPVTSFTGSQCNDYILCWTISTDCNSSSDSVNIGFHAIPTTANAGADKNIIDGSTSLILNANTPVIGAGLWAVRTGPLGTFNNSQIPNATFSGILDNIYTLTWTISTECNSSVDEVNINIYNPANIVLDYDGNIYKTVNIGTQLWMAENLKTTSFKDGESIPLVSDNTAWAALATPGYCWYNNDVAGFKPTYGALYNWYSINTNKLCPAGWHVPTDSEWTILTDFLGGESVAGGKLKESGTSHWLSPNAGANNQSGFTALPGGYRSAYSEYSNLGSWSYLWSSTEFNTSLAWKRTLGTYDNSISGGNNDKKIGFSVRCIKEVLPSISTSVLSKIAFTFATSGGNVTNDGGAVVTSRGVCWSTSQNPVATGFHTTDGIGNGTFTSSITGLTAKTTYYVRAYATNSVGTAYGEQFSFATDITDADGNSYNAVTIGTQIWMTENLKTTKYSDGTNIPLVTDNSTWGALLTPGYCWYNNDGASNKSIYGGLYNWYAQNTGKLCPKDWHVPTDAEWQILINYLGGHLMASGKLRETGLTHWLSPNIGATNQSGFTALGAGYRWSDALFYQKNYLTMWWSSTEWVYTGYPSAGWGISINTNDIDTYDEGRPKNAGLSVRCLRDF